MTALGAKEESFLLFSIGYDLSRSIYIIYIRTVSSSHLLPALLNWFMGQLGRATCTIDPNQLRKNQMYQS